MKIATKTLASLLIITMLALGTNSISPSTVSASSRGQKTENKLERLTKRHDRKLQLQASILGMTPLELKEELKSSSFEQILKRHGFKTKEDFHTAVAGKIKDELKKRGWSEEKIQKLLDKRVSRLENKI